MTVFVRTLAHIAALVALVALGLAIGQWLRDPQAGSPLLALVLLSLAIAAALRRLYRPGGLVGVRDRARAPAQAPAEPVREQAPAEPPAPLWRAPAQPAPDVDLNTATLADLLSLPGVGPVSAQRILDERAAGGPFAAIDELVRVPGFGPAKVRALSDLVRVSETDRA